MIVVDTNIIAYLFIPGERTETVKQVLRKDPHWIAPVLWRSEFLNVLAQYIHLGHLEQDQATVIMEEAEKLMLNNEFQVPAKEIITLLYKTSLAAYDCEFVVLALLNKIPLITTDTKILSEFQGIARTPDEFLSRDFIG